MVDDLNRRAKIIARGIEPVARRALNRPPPSNEENLAERLAGQERTLGILLCTPDETLIARSAPLAEIISCSDPAVRKAIQKSETQLWMGKSGSRTFHFFLDPLVERTGQISGALIVAHDATYIEQRTRSNLIISASVLIFFAALASAFTYFLSRFSYQRSILKFMEWIRSVKSQATYSTPPTSLLAPVSEEVAELAAKLRSARETAREVSRSRQVRDLWTSARLKAHAFTHFGDRKLIVISNREPYVHTREAGKIQLQIPASGVVTALDPLLKAISGLWIAHGSGEADRETSDRHGKLLVPPDAPYYTLKRVWLSKEEEDGYYYGFSNETLWPLCHQTYSRPHFEEEEWKQYQNVNLKFSKQALEECDQQTPFFLIQDYHFTLLPQMIRKERSDAVIGLFWHIPWPTPEVFRICPWKKEILKGMLGADLIGFHLSSYCTQFLHTVNTFLPVQIDWDRLAILHEGGTTLVKPFPISIQPWSERNRIPEKELETQATRIREELRIINTRLIISVDRLDYTKGIPERLAAIDLFLERYPHYRGQVSFIQLGAPTRVHIPQYRHLMTEIEKRIDEINWRHGSETWKPIHLLKQNHSPEIVYLFLRMAEICVVSSLADGMNLVAKEFVSARRNEDGVLILSEFAGVSQDFTDALQVNPYDRGSFAEALRSALEMPPDEQMKRMIRLKSQVTENNIYRWAADLLSELARFAEPAILSKIEDKKMRKIGPIF